MEIKTNINTGRPTVVTSMGDEIDVISFIANAWKHDPTLVSKGMYEGENVTPREVEYLLTLRKAAMPVSQKGLS